MHKGYCVSHREYAEGGGAKEQKKAKPLKRTPLPRSTKRIQNKKKYKNKRSKKLAAEMVLYNIEAEIYLAKHEECEIKSPVCTFFATCINHKRRRGKNLRNQDDWEPACGPCNNYCESHDAWARENGHLLSVHKKDQ